MTHDSFGGRAEQNPAQTSAAVRRDDDQINFALFSHAHDFGSGIAVNHYFFDIEAVALFALAELRQLSLSRVCQLFADVGDRQRLSQTGVADGWGDRFDDVHADDRRIRRARNRRRIGQGVVRAAAEIRGKQNRAQLG